MNKDMPEDRLGPWQSAVLDALDAIGTAAAVALEGIAIGLMLPRLFSLFFGG